MGFSVDECLHKPTLLGTAERNVGPYFCSVEIGIESEACNDSILINYGD